MDKDAFMREAVELSADNIKKRGGPFGAIIVKGGVVVGRGVNRVTASCDPTSHAEVNAIRDAARNLRTFNLRGCEIYTSCEPCPMCLGAIYWARLDKVYYANSQADAADIGFDDSFIYKEFALPSGQRRLAMERLRSEEAAKVFDAWRKIDDKITY